jgi:hypothetical protein
VTCRARQTGVTYQSIVTATIDTMLVMVCRWFKGESERWEAASGHKLFFDKFRNPS